MKRLGKGSTLSRYKQGFRFESGAGALKKCRDIWPVVGFLFRGERIVLAAMGNG